MDYKERESHAWSVDPTQDTSRIGTVRVKQQKETDKNNSKRRVRDMEERNLGTIKGNRPK